MKDQIERDCPVCGRRYHSDPARLQYGRQTTCSRACSYQLRAAKLARSEERQCGGCGKLILRAPSQGKTRHGMVFCSAECAYANRQRVVERPYNLVAVVDYKAAAKKAWKTRRRNPKPYPESARVKARAGAIERLRQGGRVSAFEREAAEVFRALGFGILTSVPIRTDRGTFAHVLDIVIPARRLVVECHGTYFHGGRWSWNQADTTQAKNLLYEERKLASVRALGLELRLLWEHEFRSDPAGACLTVVR